MLYVGVTRARTRLTVSWSLSRAEGGRKTRRRSRFLTGIAPEPRAAGLGHRSAARCRLCGGLLVGETALKLGRCHSCPSTVDPELLAVLKSWRQDRAAKASVPAYVVFTDATLLAIAEQQPVDNAALMAIRGIGRTKLDEFGTEVVAVIRSYLGARSR